ncbi:MAG: hypothetical protein PHU94_01680 [Bacilli bacterium]|nr:hypothetical protein [Bacilli bacterium]MDD4407353.1 hypothetical protein [Bacilli bacterium]
MMQIIIDIFNKDNAIKIISILGTILLSFITALLTTKTHKKNSTTEYFKKDGINIQQKLLKFWSAVLTNDYKTALNEYKSDSKEKNLTESDSIKKIMQETYMYSSKSTIKALATYQTSNFRKKQKKIKNKTISSVKTIILPSRIIKRMKYDFTGEQVSTIDLLKIKINDMNFSKLLIAKVLLMYYFVKDHFLLIFSFFVLIMFLIINLF